MDPTSQLQIQFPDIWPNKAIIALKGLPSTGKSETAAGIGRWARSQVCYIDDFLETVSLERGYTAESPPSGEEADLLHRLAFEALCRAALRYLHTGFFNGCVVIKSRLCSTFELDLLMRMVSDIHLGQYPDARVIIIIIDCQVKNEYRWHSQLGCRHYGQKRVWYKAGSWKDIEKAMEDEDFLDSQAWNLHLLSSLKANPMPFPCRVTRLVLDPFFDINFYFAIHLNSDFLDAIKYLLIGDEVDHDESMGKLAVSVCKYGYKALQYDELRRALLEMELSAPRERSKYLCTSKTTKAGSCVFKYWEELPAAAACDVEDSCCCLVCGVRVGSGQPAYTCHFCILTLHKSCAEKLGFDSRNHTYDPPTCLSNKNLWRYSQGGFHPQVSRHACESCREVGKKFTSSCESCLFETHLKGGMLPTIINHDCHQLHFLSLQFVDYNVPSCKACGKEMLDIGRYGCHICNFFCHIKCIFQPGEVEEEHGGYEHVMKLMYSRDATEPEDDHWCNFCYQDMDPQAWFYSCQECPYYVIHAYSRCAGEKNIEEARYSGNIPIRQMRDKLKLVDERPVD